MGAGAVLRRFVVLAVLGVVAGVLGPAAYGGVAELVSPGARALQADETADIDAAEAKTKPRKFSKGFWVPIPPAPSLLLARVVVTLEKPAAASSTKRDLEKRAATRPQKPIVTLRDRESLPNGLGAVGSLWRAAPNHRFVAAVAFVARTGRKAHKGGRVYVEVRSRVPIRNVAAKWKRLRATRTPSAAFGGCLFSLAERARTQHFVKRIGGQLPDALTPWDVATAVTASNCGSIRRAFLAEIGFPPGTGIVDGGSGGAGGGAGGSGGGAGGGDGSGGGSGDGGSGDGTGGGDSGGADSNPFACEGIAAAAGIDSEYVVAVSCDDAWTTLTLSKPSGSQWTAANSLEGAGTCTTPGGTVSCSLEAMLFQALVVTSSSNVPVGSTVTATVGGLPGGVTATIPIVFEEEKPYSDAAVRAARSA